MSKAEPIVQKYMTYQPHAIEVTASVKEAEKMFKDLKIRHLPVMEGSKVVGVVSDRDLKAAAGVVGVNFSKMTVKDIFHDHPYVTRPDAPLHEVCDEMAAHHYGCAIVTQHDKLVGILTTVDICKALSEILQTRFHAH